MLEDNRIAFSESNGDTEFDEACHSASFSSLNGEHLACEGNDADDLGPLNPVSPHMVITSFDESTVTEEKSQSMYNNGRHLYTIAEEQASSALDSESQYFFKEEESKHKFPLELPQNSSSSLLSSLKKTIRSNHSSPE